MWKKLLELLKSGDIDKAVEAVKLIKADAFEMSVEIETAMMDTYEAQTTRKKFARIADTIAGHQSGRDGNAWRNVAFNLDPTSGNSRVSRSYNR
jgi:hypothetical protein